MEKTNLRAQKTAGDHYCRHFAPISFESMRLFSELLMHSLPSEEEEEEAEGSHAVDERSQWQGVQFIKLAVYLCFKSTSHAPSPANTLGAWCDTLLPPNIGFWTALLSLYTERSAVWALC